MKNFEAEIRSRLFELQDSQYRDFQIRLMPTVAPESVIGVRTPELRKLAREFAKTPEALEFIKLLPHKYYEENNLHGFIIETMKNYNDCVAALDAFLPFVDNWATCDLMSPKVFKKHLPELYEKIKLWIASGDTYTVRFGIEMLMSFYLGDAFTPEMPELVARIVSEEYYVKMMVAWYFATALAKQYDAILPFFTKKRLEPWTHNKAIQKSIESYRISDETKALLRTLKVSL